MLTTTTFSPGVLDRRTPYTPDGERLTRLLAELARRHRVPAAQLTVHSGGRTAAVSTGGCGTAAKFPIGSITKPFTAALVLQLVADGDLEPGDPIGEHLPELGPQLGRLSVAQLLSHTGGLPATLGAAADGPGRRYLRACREAGPLQPPGLGFSYSNVAYVLSGGLIEAVTGMSWRETVVKLLLEPLGIEPAFTVEPGARHRDLPFVSGHAVHAVTGQARAVAQTLGAAEAPAGALALSATDLVFFGLMHCGGVSVLPEELAALMRRPVPGADPFGLADGWGLGLACYHGADADWAGHDGTADGTSCHLRVDAGHGRVVALTTNAGTGSALWADLVAALGASGLPVGDYELPGTTGGEPGLPVAGLAGRYTNADLEYRVDVPDDGEAALLVGGEPYPGLTVREDGLFSVREPGTGRRIVGGRFLTDPSTGQVSGLQTGGRVARRRPAGY
ncbi:serine hydrolase domain-containing protein [Amycolatopsis sp. PS_44_ISF1]|uniref:serine hydrolase domain-containing protein n=1 Tax=Amycolatopsis sp. PS_44_ISF1 TaxID=2974917 RepID=UPI0028DDBC40|nr:serine hydrolase domain-containing protein [Amycolatopsis sp. PS_44_ISF1]MDT8913028.1 beta-lactamase family protein [Amycolatopsis sp. PS_44_ISF1]